MPSRLLWIAFLTKVSTLLSLHLIDVCHYIVFLLLHLQIYTCIHYKILQRGYFLLLVHYHSLFLLVVFVLYNHSNLMFGKMLFHFSLQIKWPLCHYRVLLLVLLSPHLSLLLMLTMWLSIYLIYLCVVWSLYLSFLQICTCAGYILLHLHMLFLQLDLSVKVLNPNYSYLFYIYKIRLYILTLYLPHIRIYRILLFHDMLL
mmetsp:Transcript_3566/g.5246  ORF Transcript_3566/g.5246 Transcript_3566/m.5246 type:complete len:201 (-) Transcript_3566:432-1034(-)